jgi:hypothetical protein
MRSHLDSAMQAPVPRAALFQSSQVVPTTWLLLGAHTGGGHDERWDGTVGFVRSAAEGLTVQSRATDAWDVEGPHCLAGCTQVAILSTDASSSVRQARRPGRHIQEAVGLPG